MGRLRRAACAAIFVGLIAALLVWAVVPQSAFVAERGTVTCLWEDGVREESFAEASSCFDGVDEAGNLLLRRGEVRGTVQTGTAFREAWAVLMGDSLADLLGLRLSGLTPLERVAVFDRFGDVIYYAGGAFRLVGDRIEQTSSSRAKEIVLIEGDFSGSFLRNSGATTLRLCPLAELDLYDLRASAVRDFVGAGDLFVQEGGIYLRTTGGVRLMALLPTLTEATVSDCDFIDRGAFTTAVGLRKLTLPYLGNSRVPGSDFVGTLLWGMSDSDRDTMPKGLTHVTVTGGTIYPAAFYGLEAKEVVLCGIPAEDISEDAFAGADIECIHSPRAVHLKEGYTAHIAPCGCTIYERS